MAWTEDRVELLKKLWAEGLSASQIANRLGGVTRNALISKVHRSGLAGRVSASPAANPAELADRRRARERARRAAAKAKAQTSIDVPAPLEPIYEEPLDEAPEEPAPIEDIVMPRLGRLAIVALTEHMCRWPIGEQGDADFHFCGRDSPPGVPYCDFHTRIATAPAQPRRRGGSAAGQ